MSNSEIRIFYSWQSDLPSSETRGLIQDGISAAIKLLRDTVEIDADRDTKGEYGSPDIVQTIFSKIDECDIFIADVSIVNKYHSITDENEVGPIQLGPNPNVMLELGYAASVVGWENIICILNADYGSPDEFPFDLAHHRLSPYSLKESTKADVKKYIRDIVTDTVSNLIENGSRVKRSFANIIVGNFIPESGQITKDLIPYEPEKHFDFHMKERYNIECKRLIEEISAIHVKSNITEERSNQQAEASSTSDFIGKLYLMNNTPQRVIIKDSERETILKFISENPENTLPDDFFELGNLKKRVSIHIVDGGIIYEGSEEEKEKHEKIQTLLYKISHMEMVKMYSKTFDNYLLFSLAIRNVSSITDSEISVSIVVEDARPVFPPFKIINSDLHGIEGFIYEDGIIKEFLFMPENVTIKYDSDISYSIADNINHFKLHGINGAHFDIEDYERELSKYIATPQGTKNNEYEFYIKTLRPKETCWLGPMIMISRDSKGVIMRYSIKSNKSDGNLSGVLQYSEEHQ